MTALPAALAILFALGGGFCGGLWIEGNRSKHVFAAFLIGVFAASALFAHSFVWGF